MKLLKLLSVVFVLIQISTTYAKTISTPTNPLPVASPLIQQTSAVEHQRVGHITDGVAYLDLLQPDLEQAFTAAMEAQGCHDITFSEAAIDWSNDPGYKPSLTIGGKAYKEGVEGFIGIHISMELELHGDDLWCVQNGGIFGYCIKTNCEKCYIIRGFAGIPVGCKPCDQDINEQVKGACTFNQNNGMISGVGIITVLISLLKIVF